MLRTRLGCALARLPRPFLFNHVCEYGHSCFAVFDANGGTFKIAFLKEQLLCPISTVMLESSLDLALGLVKVINDDNPSLLLRNRCRDVVFIVIHRLNEDLATTT